MSLLDAGHAAAMEAIKDLPPAQPDPAPGTTPTTTPEGTQPTGEEATAPADSFTKLDPNTLPPEIRPYYDSMQGDYTRKTQEIAPLRQLQSELGLDVDGLRSAAELYTALQDPQQIVEFHSELTAALEAQGLTPAEARAAATEHVGEQMQGGGQEDLSMLDPEERRIAELEARLSRFEQSAQEREAAIQAQANQAAFVAEMNRQESLVREAHPDWTQSDIDATYELSAFYGGSLVDAAQRYDEVVSDRVTRILNGKGAAAGDPGNSPLPPAVPGVTRPHKFGSLEEAHKAAMDIVRRMPSQ